MTVAARGAVRALSFRVLDKWGNEETSLQSGKDYVFEIGYINHTHNTLKGVVVSLDMIDEKGVKVVLLRSNFTNDILSLLSGDGVIRCIVKNLPLAMGMYRFSIFLSHMDAEILDYIEDAASLNVDGGDFFGTGSKGEPNHCKLLMKAQWTCTPGDPALST